VLGTTLNFKTIAAGTHMTVTNNANDISLATDATNANTASTIVARDSSGNFSATTITADLTGNASGNVLKTGDTMSGTLLMAAGTAVRFQDGMSSNYVGVNAPSSVTANYTLSLPASAPTADQSLVASSATPTTLTWATIGGSASPASSRNIYVTKYGNDLTGTGSLTYPYASLSKAVSLANTLSTTSNPIVILVFPGTYIENNSAGPITITAGGISIIGIYLSRALNNTLESAGHFPRNSPVCVSYADK
jgi:trimeric autotransporter adhesin